MVGKGVATLVIPRPASKQAASHKIQTDFVIGAIFPRSRPGRMRAEQFLASAFNAFNACRLSTIYVVMAAAFLALITRVRTVLSCNFSGLPTAMVSKDLWCSLPTLRRSRQATLHRKRRRPRCVGTPPRPVIVLPGGGIFFWWKFW